MTTKIQIASNTDQIIKDYFKTSIVMKVDDTQAEQFYNTAVDVGCYGGTDSFDKAIDIVLKGLGLSSIELSKLTS